MRSHAQTPLLDPTVTDRARVYFGTRDEQNRTLTSYIECDPDDLTRITYVHPRPALGLGRPGHFDDSGAMPSWITDAGGEPWLYYTGWNVSTTVPYRNSIGVAAQDPATGDFTKLFPGPILDRTPDEPFFCGTPCVVRDADGWHMWYLSTTDWRDHHGHLEPFYDIKYARSDDGLRWQRDGSVAIGLDGDEEAGLVNPSVVVENGTYRMWYSTRGFRDFRTDPRTSYRLGYAESTDGVQWTRLDDSIDYRRSGEGWDDLMQAYPFVYRHDGRLLMLYNGEGFGGGGFGWAEIID